MKALVASLLAGTAAGIAFGSAQVGPLVGDSVALRIKEYMARSISSAITPKILQHEVTVELRHPPTELRRMNPFYWGGCGGGGIANYDFEPRTTKLPVDPTLVLADAYLKCQMIRAAIFEPQVPVAFYPAGYFGEYEYAGLLVRDWLEFSDETVLGQLFGLLVKVAKEPDDWEMEFVLENGSEPKLADYRQNTGFTPELLFEFVGGIPLRVEINLTRDRLLIQAGDRWDCYALDSGSAATLKALALAKQNKLPPALKAP